MKKTPTQKQVAKRRQERGNLITMSFREGQMKKTFTEEQVAKWKQECGDLITMSFEEIDEVLVFRHPTKKDMSHLVRKGQKDLVAANQNLVASCLLHPSWPSLADIFNRRPGLMVNAAVKLAECLGVDEEPTVGKL